MQQHQHRAARNLFAEHKGIDSKISKQRDPYHREKPIQQFISEVKEAIEKYDLNLNLIN